MYVRANIHAYTHFIQTQAQVNFSFVQSGENTFMLKQVQFSELYSCNSSSRLLREEELSGLLLSSSYHHKAVCVMLWW